MGIKIQINSLEALERLIGGDSELEIEIRSNIVQEFSRKHLKSIANTKAIQESIKKIDIRVNSAVEHEFKKYFEIKLSYPRMTTLKEAERKAIRNSVRSVIDTEIMALINKSIDNMDIDSMVEYISNKAINAEARRLIDAIGKEVK